MRYDGGKGISYAQIINLMPPHEKYIESHLGGGAVMRNKRPAKQQFGIDIDPNVISMWKEEQNLHCELIHGDAIETINKLEINNNTLIYADPPYYPTTRKRKKVYKHDYSIDDHVALIEFLTSRKCMVIISGYYSEYYDSELKNWNMHKFNSKTHAGIAEEYVWFNFDKPKMLHDSRFLGANFREREIIKRRTDRLKNRISKLPIAEQSALREWLDNEINEVMSA